MEQRTKQALRWITSLLRSSGVPFQAAGGLAARAYGATRPIIDLDFYIPKARLADVAERAAGHVEWGPAHVREAGWDITFMKLSYAGQQVELAGAEDVRIFDPRAGCWVEARVDLSASEEREVLGEVVPVMPLRQLEAYKRQLDRDVDRQDLMEMGASAGEA